MASLLPSQQNLDVQQDRQVGTQSLERVYYILHLGEGMGAEEKRKKTKIIPIILSPRPRPDGPNASD